MSIDLAGFDAASNASNEQLDTCDAWVLGGGISGITTALVLQSLGLRVAILSDAVTMQSSNHQENPRVATGYAMASAYPHNLRVKDLEGVSAQSQKAFEQLRKVPESGVSIYRMFEVYEHEPEEAALGNRRMKFQTFEGTPEALAKTLNPPTRPGAKHVWGWSFETYFADMPFYLPFLWKRFFRKGGCIREERIDLHDDSMIARAGGKPLVNCLGLGAIESLGAKRFADRTPALIVRGRQAIAHNAPVICDSDGVALAYNYTPTVDVFARADGLPEYVHFFPRSDGWVLGQTREPGELSSDGTWTGSAVQAAEIVIGEQSIPKPIVDLNDEILSQWVNQRIQRDSLSAREGFRYYRDPDDTGVRLEPEIINNSTIVHNYGHGGSGITMSWGCALEAARFVLEALRQPTDFDRKRSNSDNFDELLISCMAGDTTP